MDPATLLVQKSKQFVVKINSLCNLTGAEVCDLVSDCSDDVVSHCEGENIGETSQVKQLEHHKHFVWF